VGEVSTVVVLAIVFASFVVSASVGFGGSLLMVPTLVLALGSKQGVALAALLLATNNVCKLLGYRRTMPWRAAAVIVGAVVAGAALGARLLVHASPAMVGTAVLVSFALSLLLERANIEPLRRHVASPGLALAAGATSGFSGTSGPLKGVAIRNLELDRLHFVGAASLVSFAGDATKTAIFTDAALLDSRSYAVAGVALPLMVAGTALGRHLNGRVDERGFSLCFWSVMTGYSIRLITIIA
jgi:uncharacterized membrane protein YfcA